MQENQYKKLSMFLAYVLRHRPEAAGIKLDKNGWVSIGELIMGVRKTGRRISDRILEEIVETDGKMRFSFNGDKSKIRANQGHSIPVDLGLSEKAPPNVLYHGTAERFSESIMSSGIKRGTRNFVHLSQDVETAEKVGARHGEPTVFEVMAKEMHNDGYKFYLSENGVWLTAYVPNGYIQRRS